MDTFDVECVVIGAGVVGLACAAALAEQGLEVLVVERNGAIGEEVSARNSEVIHAGIYYQPDSLKARLCVDGKQRLYRYCEERTIPYRNLGKLIVACEQDEIPALKSLMDTGRKNGAGDLRWLSAGEAIALEPALHCEGAVLSPSTGIVDSHTLMLSLAGDLESAGGAVALRTTVTAIEPNKSGVGVAAVADGNSHYIQARRVVNCAGLCAVSVARSVTSQSADQLPIAWFSKGNYFRLAGSAPFSTLIYPAPVAGGLGVHLTLDLNHQARFGPDVEQIDGAAVDLSVDPDRGQAFYASIRRYWPDLANGSLEPDYAGIRPKIQRPGENRSQFSDFAILGPADHGVDGLVHCLGIESPGLTSSLAIAAHVAGLVSGVRVQI